MAAGAPRIVYGTSWLTKGSTVAQPVCAWNNPTGSGRVIVPLVIRGHFYLDAAARKEYFLHRKAGAATGGTPGVFAQQSSALSAIGATELTVKVGGTADDSALTAITVPSTPEVVWREASEIAQAGGYDLLPKGLNPEDVVMIQPGEVLWVETTLAANQYSQINYILLVR